MTENKTILIIDDEPDTLTYFSSLLQDNGFNTVLAENGDEGLKKVKEAKPDLITLDITMPEKSGVRCYRELRENPDLASIPVVIVTGVAKDFKNFISSRRQVPPPDGFISKPIDKQELLATVSKFL